jgi:hypothetical protein
MKKFVFVMLMAFSVSLVSADDPKKDINMNAQTYQIEGTVIDNQTGEALVGVTLKLKGGDQKFYTDLNGNFEINDLSSGTYDIEVDYVSYKDITLKDVSTLTPEINIKVELESLAQAR